MLLTIIGYVNISPYLGYRFILNRVKLDFLPGFDNALGAGHHETINVKANDNTYYNTPTNNFGSGTDLRFKLGAAAYYQKFGVTASWSRGINHYEQYADAYIPPEHLEVFRLGVSCA